jgi:hypothetical protein
MADVEHEHINVHICEGESVTHAEHHAHEDGDQPHVHTPDDDEEFDLFEEGD